MAGLQHLVDAAVAAALETFAPLHLRADELAVTLVDLRDSLSSPERGEIWSEEANAAKIKVPSPQPSPRLGGARDLELKCAQHRSNAPSQPPFGHLLPHGGEGWEEGARLGRRVPGPKSIFAQYRGDAPVYPASVVKLFYLVAAHRQMEDKAVSDTPELRRALHDMIVHSGNEATGYVLDVLTGTTSGPELAPAELAAWGEKRNAVNRYFHSLGFTDINANRKTWHDGPYGRDKQAVDQFSPAKNSLTTNATARLLVEIYCGRCVSSARSAQMLELLKRDFADPGRADHQACEFIGAVLPAGARLWSKAGYMSVARHDAALLELPGGGKLALVIFTEQHSDAKEIIPAIARQIVDGFNS